MISPSPALFSATYVGKYPFFYPIFEVRSWYISTNFVIIHTHIN